MLPFAFADVYVLFEANATVTLVIAVTTAIVSTTVDVYVKVADIYVLFDANDTVTLGIAVTAVIVSIVVDVDVDVAFVDVEGWVLAKLYFVRIFLLFFLSNFSLS